MVLLPLPEGPTNATDVPGSMMMDRSRRMGSLGRLGYLPRIPTKQGGEHTKHCSAMQEEDEENKTRPHPCTGTEGGENTQPTLHSPLTHLKDTFTNSMRPLTVDGFRPSSLKGLIALTRSKILNTLFLAA